MAPIEGDKLRGHLAGLILASLEAGAAHGWESGPGSNRPATAPSGSRRDRSIRRCIVSNKKGSSRRAGKRPMSPVAAHADASIG